MQVGQHKVQLGKSFFKIHKKMFKYMYMIRKRRRLFYLEVWLHILAAELETGTAVPSNINNKECYVTYILTKMVLCHSSRI